MLAGPSPAQAVSISGNTNMAARVVDIPTCHSPFESFGKTLKGFARPMESGNLARPDDRSVNGGRAKSGMFLLDGGSIRGVRV